MNQTQRAHSRYLLEMAAEIAAGETRFTAVTKNVSVGGCCIASAYPLAEGAAIKCSLYVVVDGIEEAGLPPLTTSATVQWAADTDEPGPERHVAGLKFAELTQQQQDWLAGVIAKAEATAR